MVTDILFYNYLQKFILYGLDLDFEILQRMEYRIICTFFERFLVVIASKYQ